MTNLISPATVTQEESFVHSTIVNASNPLETVLEEICRTTQVTVNGITNTVPVYDYRHTWKISIAAGYNATVTKRWYNIRCCISIVGLSTSRNKIYFTTGIFSEGYGNGDAIFAILSNSLDKQLTVHVENLEFMPIGAEEGATFRPSSSTIFTKEQHLFKIYFAKKVTFFNVKSTLINGKISNIDLRTCSNVLIKDCNLINYNGVLVDFANQSGSNIMLRGTMDNVMVTGCTFEKYGNDEIISIFGNNEPEYAYKEGIPEAERGTIMRRNIRITQNTFRYLRPTINGVKQPSNEQHVLISFAGYEASSTSGKNVYWENVWVAYNTFEITELVRRVFSFYDMQYTGETFGFRVFGNTITRNYTFTSEDAWCLDFDIKRTKESPTMPNQPIEIAYNKVYASETIGNSNLGHICIGMQGLSADIHDNLFDATNFKANKTNTWQPDGPVILRCTHYAANVLFRNNKCYNAGHLGSLNSVYADQVFNFTFINNYVQGEVNFVTTSTATEAHFRYEGNFFDSTGYYMLFISFPNSGSIWASNNLWFTHTKNGETKTAYCHNVKNMHIERVCCLSNVVAGERAVVNNTVPNAYEFVAKNNIPGIYPNTEKE